MIAQPIYIKHDTTALKNSSVPYVALSQHYIAHLCKIIQLTMLKTIAGDGCQLETSKLLHPKIHRIISPDELKRYSWTGKDNKIAFTSYEQINGLIHRLLRLADSSYTFIG